MSTEQADILKGIRTRIASLSKLLDEERETNGRLKEECASLQEQLGDKDLKIRELGEQNQKLSLVSGISAGGSQSHEARVQINRIVREIDKCIALLNK